ncbi:MAG: carboxypeptidase-like regulatory domain-containing protein, partial [Myxococcota bacterium]
RAVADPQPVGSEGQGHDGHERHQHDPRSWLPGQDAPSLVPAATSVDFLAALERPLFGSALRVALNTGFRVDNSAEAAEDTFALSRPDRLSLGVSESDAVLLGAGLSWRIGAVEVVGEVTWDLLVGDRAPPRQQSPLRVAAGVRIPLGSAMVAQLIFESNLAEHPSADALTPLSPFEPRLSVSAGLHYSLGRWRSAPEPAAAPPPTPATPTPAAPTPAVVAGTVVDDGDVPVADAEVTLARSGIGAGGEPTEPRTTRSDASGRFRFGDVPPGALDIAVTRDGYVAAERTLTVAEAEQREITVTLTAELPPGQLRGTIRSFRGQGVRARLVIEPGGLTVDSSDDGTFSLDIPPGSYQVTVSADGYAAQTRPVEVEEGGVTVLNIDLRRGRRR